MSSIIRFNSEKEFIAYRKKKTYKELGHGSEGTCFKGTDGLAYKDLTAGLKTENYVLNEIITTSDVNNDSFAFPHILFAVKDELVGYTADAIKNDYIDYNYMFFYGIDHIDFEKLAKAYTVMRKNVISLSKEKIGIFDLSFNLMFDGEKLSGVDTCRYFRADEELTKYNIGCLDAAIKDLFSMYVEQIHDEKVDKNMEVIQFLKMIENKYSNHEHRSGNPYIKQ